MARVEGGFCGLSYWSFSLSLFLSQKQNTAFSPTLALLNISQTRFPFFWHVCGFLLRTDLYEVKCDGNTKKSSLSFREIQLRHISRQKWGSCEEESNKSVFVHVSSRSWAKAHQIEIRVTCDLNAHWQRNRMRKTNFNMFFFNTKFWFWASVFEIFCHSFDTRDVCLSCSHFMHLYLILSLRTLLVKALFYIAAVFLFRLYLSTHDMSVHFKCFQKSACLSSHFSSVSGGGKQFSMPQISFHLFFHSYHFPLSAVTISTRWWVHC